MVRRTLPNGSPSISDLLKDREFLDKFFHITRGYTSTDDEAREVTQKVICYALQKNLEEIQNLEAYLITACVNGAKDLYRNKGRFCELDDNVADDEDNQPDRLLEKDELKSLVQEILLSRLKPKEAEVLTLRCRELSYREIAEEMKVPEGTVATWIARATKKFEKEALKAGLQYYL